MALRNSTTDFVRSNCRVELEFRVAEGAVFQSLEEMSVSVSFADDLTVPGDEAFCQVRGRKLLSSMTIRLLKNSV